MKTRISYDNVTRIETYPLPKSAVLEHGVIERKGGRKNAYWEIVDKE